MAERWAVANGNWSSTGTWNGGTLPTSADDVYANGFTVQLDQTITALSIRTSAGTTAVAGGGFNVSTAGITLNLSGGLGVVSGTTRCLLSSLASPNSFTVNGNITGGPSGSANGLQLTGTGSVVVNGNVTGGSAASSNGILNSSSGNITVNGTVTGGSNSSASGITATAGIVTINNGTNNAVIAGSTSSTAYGLNIGTSAVFNITGHVISSTSTRAISMSSTSSGNTIIGNVSAENGTHCIDISGAGGSLSVTGNVTGSNFSSSLFGINCDGTNKILTITGNILAGTSTSPFGVSFNSAGGTFTLNGNTNGSSGASAVGTRINAVCTVNINGSCNGGSGTSSHGLLVNAAATVNIVGNVIGGSGSTAHGLNNASTGTVVVNGIVRGAATTGGVGLFNASTGSVTIAQAEFGAEGWPPYTGIVNYIDLTTARLTVENSSFAARTLLPAGYIRWPVATGVWSNQANWDYGLTMPQSTDEVHADGKNVTIDQDVTVLTIETTPRPGGLNGGSFICTSNRTINAHIIAGGGHGLNITGNCTVVVNGSVTGGANTNIYGIRIAAVVNLTVNGTVTGGTASGCMGIMVDIGSGASVIVINGNVVGGEGISARGLQTAANGSQSIMIVGNVLGSVGNGGEGVYLNSSGCSFTVTGTLTARGGHAFQQLAGSSGVTGIINGDIYSSSTAGARYGFIIGGTGTFTVNGASYGGSQSNSYGTYVSGNATYVHNGNAVGSSGGNSYGIYIAAGSCVFTLNGNALGGSAGIGLVSSSPFTMTGNAQGGTASSVYGVWSNAGSGTITFTGNAQGGTALNTHGLAVSNFNGTVNVYGNATGGSGQSSIGVANLGSTAILNLYGNATGGSHNTAYGAHTSTSGEVNVYGFAIGHATNGAPGVNGGTGIFTIYRGITGAQGVPPWSGNGKIFFNDLNMAYIIVNDVNNVQRMLGRRAMIQLGGMQGGFDG